MPPELLIFDGVSVNGAGRPITLSLAPHETVSVVGDDEHGIDQLGRLAMGLTVPTDGTMRLLDVDLASLGRRDLFAIRRRVGYLPAGDGLLQNLSLADNVALPLRFGSDLSEREITSRLGVMLAMAGLGQGAALRPAQATDEQRRRAALARALAFDPSLVILEEPFVGLTDRAARYVLETARGGDVGEGSRRTVLTVGPSLPSSVVRRFDRRYRLTPHGLREET